MPTATARWRSRACWLPKAQNGWRSAPSRKASGLRRGGIRQARILVMGGFLPHEGDALVEHHLTPVVHSLDQLGLLEQLGRESGKPIPYHLKIDSGMDRLGTRAGAAEILAALGENRHARLEGLMTHFASAADYTSSQTGDQLAYFHAICARLREARGERGVPAHVEHQCRRLWARGRLAQHGARRPRAIRLRVSGARRRAPPTPGREARAHLEGQTAGGQGGARGGSHRLRRNVPRAPPHAHRDSGRGLCRRRVSPALESRQGRSPAAGSPPSSARFRWT